MDKNVDCIKKVKCTNCFISFLLELKIDTHA